LYLGESAFFGNRPDDARKLFLEVTGDSRADEFVRQRAYVLLLDIAAHQQQWPELLRLASEFATQLPNSEQRPYARYRLSEGAIETGELDQAVQELTLLTQDSENQAITGAEWYPSVWVLLAEAWFRKKDYRQVEATVAEFRTRLPESPYLYHADEVLGRSYKNQAQLAKAREAFTRVIDSETGRRTETAAKAQFHIAETYLIEKNFEAALAEYYKVYVSYRYPEWQAPALFQAGQCDESLQRWDGATKTYETLIAEFPESEFAKQAQARLEVTRTKPTE
jgi:outer membrane protein assembly factor BamD (BamD/ComL family)